MQEGKIYTADTDGALLKYSDMVYKISLSQTRNRADADDVFQEVFLRLITHKEKILSEEHLKAWLIRVTLNCVKKHFRTWRASEPLGDIPYVTPEEHDVFYAVLELPRKYRTVIHLFYYEELSIKDISGLLNIKETTVKSQLSRGRAMLKARLGGEVGEYV